MNTNRNWPNVVNARRREAEERHAKYDALTPAQKLARLDKLGLRAERERARIQKQMS